MKRYLTIILTGVIFVLFTGITMIGFFAEAYESHTFPTFIFTASYDWLHNFYDRNDYSSGGNQTDPDTDNFNKIIVIDSNLFPIMTAVFGDHEFPNITVRNATTWDASSPSLYSPSINDYFNRSIAVAPDFISTKTIKYATVSTVPGSDPTYHYRDIEQYGARAFMQWAFVTDPGNHNIRRYEFQKLGGFYAGLDAGDGPELGANEGEDATSVCNQAEGAWYTGDTYDVLDADYDPSYVIGHPQRCSGDWGAIPATLGPDWSTECGECDPTDVTLPHGCYENDTVLWTCKHGEAPYDDDGEGETATGNYENGGNNVPQTLVSASDLANYIAGGNYYDYLEYAIVDITDYESGGYTLPIEICGNSRESSSYYFAIGINTKNGDNRPIDYPTAYGTFAPVNDFQVIGDNNGDPPLPADDSPWTAMGFTGFERDCKTYSITVDDSYDLDPGKEGLQFRMRFYALKQGGFVIDKIEIGDRDSAFAVKYGGDESQIETRWGVITSFLETIPPESFPGYQSYTSSTRRIVGYGSETNTAFHTATSVRFKNPRDIAVYRDVFDTATSVEPDNGAPLYIFVADTMNSRIQVFMNATASAGKTNAPFPIRPVRVNAPTDVGNITPFKSNELAMRIYTGVNGTSVGFGDGRKADWRHYTTVSGDTWANSVIPANAGRGKFFYPHGVAVDQDPNTKDIYLFVADTFNHRIQVFRDSTGVTFHNITAKYFDFRFETGWGTYPLQTTETVTPPGPFHFRYPKGLDIARFANNSSYLYVVDSKNYRLLKYLLTENDAGGISNVEIEAGYGYKGTGFATNLTTMAGQPLTAHRSFEDSNTAAVGFLNPQDVATGYSGFYTYSGPDFDGSASTKQYEHELDRGTGVPKLGIKYLNNYMVYVTDYARNNTSIVPDRLNMRVMQFVDNLRNINGVPLPWRTETVQFDKGELGQSALGIYYGVYSSQGEQTQPYSGSTRGSHSTGSTENVLGRARFFTDRPVGIAALTWNTVTPFDMRVVHQTSDIFYPNGTTIPPNTPLWVGVRTRGFFGIPGDPGDAPEGNMRQTFMNYTAEKRYLDGKGLDRVHVFCYNSSGSFVGYTGLWEPPYQFTPNDANIGCVAGGYMKIIAEDEHFEYSGKSGTKIFKMQ